jgi:hypothetical protein
MAIPHTNSLSGIQTEAERLTKFDGADFTRSARSDASAGLTFSSRYRLYQAS